MYCETRAVAARFTYIIIPSTYYCIVMILNERTITLNITTLDTVKKLKEKIQSEVGICVDQLTLSLGEKQLQDDHLMTYDDVSTGSLLEIKLGNYTHTIQKSKTIQGYITK